MDVADGHFHPGIKHSQNVCLDLWSSLSETLDNRAHLSPSTRETVVHAWYFQQLRDFVAHRAQRVSHWRCAHPYDQVVPFRAIAFYRHRTMPVLTSVKNTVAFFMFHFHCPAQISCWVLKKCDNSTSFMSYLQACSSSKGWCSCFCSRQKLFWLSKLVGDVTAITHLFI